MITKFKIFENQNIYNIGDYIKAYDNRLHEEILNCCQIIRIDEIKRKNIRYYTEYIRTIDNTSWSSEKEIEILRGLIGQEDIERLSSPEEIEEFESLKAAKKYNL